MIDEPKWRPHPIRLAVFMLAGAFLSANATDGTSIERTLLPPIAGALMGAAVEIAARAVKDD